MKKARAQKLIKINVFAVSIVFASGRRCAAHVEWFCRDRKISRTRVRSPAQATTCYHKMVPHHTESQTCDFQYGLGKNCKNMSSPYRVVNSRLSNMDLVKFTKNMTSPQRVAVQCDFAFWPFFGPTHHTEVFFCDFFVVVLFILSQLIHCERFIALCLQCLVKLKSLKKALLGL